MRQIPSIDGLGLVAMRQIPSIDGLGLVAISRNPSIDGVGLVAISRNASIDGLGAGRDQAKSIGRWLGLVAFRRAAPRAWADLKEG
jgi:hypothetical protein